MTHFPVFQYIVLRKQYRSKTVYILFISEQDGVLKNNILLCFLRFCDSSNIGDQHSITLQIFQNNRWQTVVRKATSPKKFL